MNSLKTLFACTVHYQYNLQILHWKVKGCHFDSLHSIMQDYQNKFNEFIDIFGEMLIAVGDNPMTLKDIESFIESDEKDYIILSADDSYDEEEAFKCVGYMFKQLIELCENVKKYENLPSDIRANIDGIQYYLRMEAYYKNKMRLK